MVFSGMALNPLDDGGHAHAAADAQRDQRATGVAALELVAHGAGDHRAGGAQRVAHRDGAAVDVELVVGNVEVLLELQHHRRERLVQLEQVDVIDRQARAVEHLARGGGRAGEQDEPVRAAGERGGELRAPPSPMPELSPPVWTWFIFSTKWYFCSATSSKPPISPMPSKAVFSLPR